MTLSTGTGGEVFERTHDPQVVVITTQKTLSSGPSRYMVPYNTGWGEGKG